jgi:hypothetical protein
MAITVPDELAGPLLSHLVRSLGREVRESGGLISREMLVFLRDLQAIESPVADDGPAEGAPEMIEEVMGLLTVSQLAEQSGYGARTIRRWAAGGMVRAVRAGPVWLVDPESLKSGGISA